MLRCSRAFTAAAWLAMIHGLSAEAFASPRESVTFSDVESRERLNDPTNITRTFSLAGGYAVGRLRLTGSLTNVAPASFASEARVLITSPAGRTIAIQPFVTGGFAGTLTIDPALEYILQPAEVEAAGTWTIQFYESRSDAPGADALWNSLTLVFDDQPPPPPPGDHTTAENLGELGAGAAVLDRESLEVFPAVKWYRFDVPVPATTATNIYLDLDCDDTVYGAGEAAITDTEIALFHADGSLVAQDDDDGTGLASMLSFGAISSRPGGYQSQDGPLAAGTYYLAIAPYNATFSSGFGVSTTGVAYPGDLHLRITSGFKSPPVAPDALDLGALPQGETLAPQVSLSAGGVAWYAFTLNSDADASLASFLDLDTEGSVLTGGEGVGNDTMIGLYDEAGNRVSVDDDDGSGRLSQLAFGGGSTTAPVGDSAAYDGRDGLLPAGRYFLAVTGFGNTSFGPTGWSVYTEHARTGTLAVRAHTNTGQPSCPADFNGDAFIDFFDYDDYVNCFESGTCPPGRTADFNNDEFVDFFDYDDFVGAFEAGC